MVNVEIDEEVFEVALMFDAHAVDELFRRDAGLLGAEHDRGAMRVVGANVMHRMALHALETHPDVGLDVAEHVPEMDRAIGEGQCVGDENVALGHRDFLLAAKGGHVNSLRAGLAPCSIGWRTGRRAKAEVQAE
jgi:hypothetical protein